MFILFFAFLRTYAKHVTNLNELLLKTSMNKLSVAEEKIVIFNYLTILAQGSLTWENVILENYWRGKEVVKPNVPGQGIFWLQTWLCFASPSHFFPPYWGAGELHSRVLDCFPCLHVLVQVLHPLHSPQFPSTEIIHAFRNFLLQRKIN